MTFGTFLEQFKSFVNRKDSELTDAKYTSIINLGKVAIQRDYDLDFITKKLAAQTYTIGGFALPADFKKFAYQQSVVLTTAGGGIVPIEGTNFSTVLRRTKASGPQNISGQSLPVINSSAVELTKYYLQTFLTESPAPKLFLVPESALVFDLYYNAWLPDYDVDVPDYTDFLLTYGVDALLFASLEKMNSFLLAEDKIPVDAAEKEKAIDGIVAHCREMDRSGSFIDGD